MISRSEIMKNKSPSKENFAAEGGKNIFTPFLPRWITVMRLLVIF